MYVGNTRENSVHTTAVSVIGVCVWVGAGGWGAQKTQHSVTLTHEFLQCNKASRRVKL